MLIRNQALTILCLLSPVIWSFAKDKSISPTPTVTDTFDRPELGPKWKVLKGEWKIEKSSIVGKDLKTDEHAAVLAYQHRNHNSIIKFSFKLDGAKGFNLSYNKKRGHLFRVIVTGQRLLVRLDKDKKDPKSKPKLLGAARVSFKQKKWYDLQVVLQGSKATVTSSNGARLVVEHPDLDQPKPNYRFVMRGGHLMLDNLKVWDL